MKFEDEIDPEDRTQPFEEYAHMAPNHDQNGTMKHDDFQITGDTNYNSPSKYSDNDDSFKERSICFFQKRNIKDML